MKILKSGFMFVSPNFDHSKNWTKMDVIIFYLGIFGLYFVQFLSFILYIDTDSDRPRENICIKIVIQGLQGWEKFMQGPRKCDLALVSVS